MDREYTRQELLVEVVAAASRLRELGARGDLRRFTDDEVFRFALAYLWLRLAEPACQLVTRRLVGEMSMAVWSGLCPIRNALAHERDEDINYQRLWVNVPAAVEASLGEADRLLAST